MGKSDKCQYGIFPYAIILSEVIILKTRIRDLREDHDLNQTEIANLLNVHQSTYSDYELEKLDLPIQALPILAKFYKTSTDYILYLTDNPTPYK